MIGFAQELIETVVLAPQDGPDVDPDRRLYLDPESAPVDASPQEADVFAISTVPVRYEIGGGLEVRHTVDVAVDVQHGVPEESRRRRDLITLDLCLRALDNLDALGSAVDPETGQYVTRVEWSVDYRPLSTTGTNESATIRFTLDAQVDR